MSCPTDPSIQSSRHGPLRAVRHGVAKILKPEVAAWAALQGAVVTVAIVTAMLLGGCANFSERFSDLAPSASIAAPETVAAGKTFAPFESDGAWPRVEWWKKFGDSGLDALMDEASDQI